MHGPRLSDRKRGGRRSRARHFSTRRIFLDEHVLKIFGYRLFHTVAWSVWCLGADQPADINVT